MKQKNLVKKALFPAIIALLCSFVALTSVSYAWFTMGNKAEISELNMNVTAADGLQISSDGVKYGSTLTSSELKGKTGNIIFEENHEVSPVSTVGTVVEGDIQFFTAVDDKGTLKDIKESTRNDKNFIVFDFYLNITAPDKVLQLDKKSFVECINNLETHLSVRVAFCHLGSADKPSDALALKLDSNDAITIWEPNAMIRSAKAILNGADENTKLDYDGVQATTTPTTKAVTTVAPAQDADLLTTEVQKLFDLSAGYNKVRVYIWLEGQDVDCVNEASGGQLSILLNFVQADKQ